MIEVVKAQGGGSAGGLAGGLAKRLTNSSGAAVMANPAAAPASETYDSIGQVGKKGKTGHRRTDALNQAGFVAAEKEITQWPGYEVTALHNLTGLARKLNLSSLHYKDESTRFTLKSFKALGGAYAVFRLIQQAIATSRGGTLVTPDQVIRGDRGIRDIVSQITVTCATDGNHGRSVAWGAQTFGCRCVIYVHASVSEGRAQAIADFGAEVVRLPGNYDESVRHAASQAQQHGWTVVSDTTYEGYRDIPIDVMHGYGVMSREIVRQLNDEPPTHVIVQAGVGAFAASVCAVFWLQWGAARPRFIVVEPERAACLFESGRTGQLTAIEGELDTVMAGLACGEVSPVAWEILANGINDFATLADHHALEAMRVFAQPEGTDPVIVSGETGTTGLGLLMAAHESPTVWQALGLTQNARVLILGSEGDTDPDIYKEVVGKTAAQVLAGELSAASAAGAAGAAGAASTASAYSRS